MTTTKTITTTTCDLCGKTSDEVRIMKEATESYNVFIRGILFSMWYGKDTKVSDICERCNTELAKFIIDKGWKLGVEK